MMYITSLVMNFTIFKIEIEMKKHKEGAVAYGRLGNWII